MPRAEEASDRVHRQDDNQEGPSLYSLMVHIVVPAQRGKERPKGYVGHSRWAGGGGFKKQ